MVFSRLGVSNAFSTYDIFNLLWVYWDVTSLLAKEDLYFLIICILISLPLYILEFIWPEKVRAKGVQFRNVFLISFYKFELIYKTLHFQCQRHYKIL